MSPDYFGVFILLLAVLYFLNLYDDKNNKYLSITKKVIEVTALLLLVVIHLLLF